MRGGSATVWILDGLKVTIVGNVAGRIGKPLTWAELVGQ